MKNTIKILALSLVLVSSSVFASFPVKKVSNTEKTEIATTTSETAKNLEKTSSLDAKKTIKKQLKEAKKGNGADSDMIVLLLLWLFLGGLAGHRWYAKKPVGWNILFILTLGGLLVWAIIDLVHILKGDFMD